ncbi:lasso peptide isopeptide bond-forming cyclase [Methanobacterium sp. ACI-7]|uniref:lasso peptide isopeptide bond-forming cyclase n=1 Tax=unclassified Methanobacterium TaxID=2627676 RepID=UPI0039C04F2F
MSAITGIFYRNGRDVDSNLMEKMNNCLSHRGPDGSNVWIKESVGLGHQMLWTTPESIHETLPFEEGNFVITSDARIDNRKELSRELNIENNEKISDSYFILKSYEKWGEDCPKKLIGDFAFAIWDKEKETLFCARDHMGVKPFYYYLSDEGFFFATEIKALLKIPEIPIEINELRIADYLIEMYEDRENTFYENVLRLPAANSLHINFKECRLDHYWTLDPKYRLKLNSDEEYTQVFRETFIKAVKCRLRSSYPVGSELSGGLDSSSISCTAQKILSKYEKCLKTFSLVFKGFPSCNEQHYINVVSNKSKSEAYYTDGSLIDQFKELENSIWPQEEPISAHSAHMYLHLYEKAYNEGLRVILSGYDGDSTLGAHANYFNDLLKKKRIKYLINEILSYSKIYNISPYNLIINEVIGPCVPNFIKSTWRSLFGNNNDVYQLNALNVINQKYANKINVFNRMEVLTNHNKNKIKNAHEWHYHHLSSGIFQHALEEMDKISAANFIELRYPFFDKRLLDLCLSMPSDQKMKNGWNRIVMRRAMENVLPYEIQWRYDKAITDNVINSSFMKFGEKELEEMLSEENVISKYIDFEKLDKIYQKFKLNAYKEEYPGFEQSIIWLVYKLNFWYNHVSIKQHVS